MLKKWRAQLKPIWDDDNLHGLVNVLLVFAKGRCATLLEPREVGGKKGVRLIKKIMPSHIDMYEEEDHLSFVLYNKDCVSPAQAVDVKHSMEKMGRALEYLCPGKMAFNQTRYIIDI